MVSHTEIELACQVRKLAVKWGNLEEAARQVAFENNLPLRDVKAIYMENAQQARALEG